MLFTIFESEILVCELKPKEMFNLERASILFDNTPAGTLGMNNSENNKYKFKILIPTG